MIKIQYCLTLFCLSVIVLSCRISEKDFYDNLIRIKEKNKGHTLDAYVVDKKNISDNGIIKIVYTANVVNSPGSFSEVTDSVFYVKTAYGSFTTP